MIFWGEVANGSVANELHTLETIVAMCHIIFCGKKQQMGHINFLVANELHTLETIVANMSHHLLLGGKVVNGSHKIFLQQMSCILWKQ